MIVFSFSSVSHAQAYFTHREFRMTQQWNNNLVYYCLFHSAVIFYRL